MLNCVSKSFSQKVLISSQMTLFSSSLGLFVLSVFNAVSHMSLTKIVSKCSLSNPICEPPHPTNVSTTVNFFGFAFFTFKF